MATKWVWLNIKELGLRRCWSLVPFTKVPFWYMSFEPQPNGATNPQGFRSAAKTFVEESEAIRSLDGSEIPAVSFPQQSLGLVQKKARPTPFCSENLPESNNLLFFCRVPFQLIL